MFCPTCGREVSPETNFCPNCGNRITWEKLICETPETAVEPEPVEPEAVAAVEPETVEPEVVAAVEPKTAPVEPKPPLATSAKLSLIFGAICVFCAALSFACAFLPQPAAFVITILLFFFGCLAASGALVPCVIALVNGIRKKQRSWRRCAIWGLVMGILSVVLFLIAYMVGFFSFAMNEINMSYSMTVPFQF